MVTRQKWQRKDEKESLEKNLKADLAQGQFSSITMDDIAVCSATMEAKFAEANVKDARILDLMFVPRLSPSL